MRYILSVVLIFAVAAPEAYALPTVGTKALELSKSNPILQAAKHVRAKPSRQKSSAASGIHPLVGSGGY
jgi:hypothetical protein